MAIASVRMQLSGSAIADLVGCVSGSVTHDPKLSRCLTTHHFYYTTWKVRAIASGLSAGIFFAFSTFVMKALAQQPPTQGIATMQSINITVINPWFMVAFLGPAAVCIFLTISLLLQWHQPVAFYWLAGSLLYLIGTIGVTFACNVPLNDALAIVTPDSAEGTTLWARFLTDWTFWNHVRTVAALLAAALFTISLCVREAPKLC